MVMRKSRFLGASPRLAANQAESCEKCKYDLTAWIKPLLVMCRSLGLEVANKVRHELVVTLVRAVLLDGLHGDSPLLDEDGAGLRDGGVLDGPDLLLADPAVGAEEDLDADRHVVLPEQEHVLAEVLILLALESNEMEERN